MPTETQNDRQLNGIIVYGFSLAFGLVIASLQALKPTPENYWRYQAAGYLGEMGPAIKTLALPKLRKFRDDPDPIVRSSVLQAIQRIEGPANKE